MTRRKLKAPPSLLILHLDSDKLRADGLLLSDLAEFASVVSTLVSGATVVTRQTTHLQSLTDELDDLVRQGHRFDVVVAVGHSNERRIVIARDEFVGWEDFARHVKPLEPRRLVLVACQAGRWPAARVLFRKLPKLRRIFASPVNASKDVGKLMIALAPYLVEVKAPKNSLVLRVQAVLAATTGCQVRQWMRKDKDDPAGLLLDLAAAKAHPVVQELHGALRRLFK